MKLKLPLILMTCLLTSFAAVAQTTEPAPEDGGDVSISQSAVYQVTEDTTYSTSLFDVASDREQKELNVFFEGDGTQSLTLYKEGEQNKKRAQFQLAQPNEQTNQVEKIGLSFSNLKELSLGGTYGAVEIAGAKGDALFSISDIKGNVLMDNNSMLSGSNTAAAVVSLHSSGNNTISISNIEGKLSISNNTRNSGAAQSGLGLLIYTYNKTTDNVDCLINITGVKGGIDVRNNTFSAGQGVIAIFNDIKNGSAVVKLQNISNGISFVNNNAESGAFGACLSSGCKVEWGDGLFAGDAEILLSNVQGNILFSGNKSSAGSALFVNGTESRLSISDVNGNVSFINNRAESSWAGHGGAIYFETGCVSENNVLFIGRVNGEVLFEGNSADFFGGAICSSAPTEADSAADAQLILSADGGDIIFRHNIMYAGGSTPIANAILADGKHAVELGAAEGRRIAFYDPLVIQDEENASSAHFNKDGSQTGEILFSGRDHLDSGNTADYTSTLTGDAIQYGGTVHLEHRAGLELINYTQEGGELMMGSGATLTASGNVSLKTLTIDLYGGPETASISATGNVSADQVAVYGSAADLAGKKTPLSIKADSFGGILGKGGEHEVAMRDAVGMSYQLGMNWSLNEEGALVFSVGSIIEQGVIAELKGGNVANSMLSSASNLRSLSDTTLRHTDTARFLSPLRANVWTSGLGDFNMQRAEGSLEGFDYQGGGFSIGGDYRFGKEWLVGVAYGELFGKNISREFRATNEQNSIMGVLYAGWRRELRHAQAVLLTGAFSFGSTDNELESVTAAGQNSSGSWRNRTFSGIVRASWDIPLDSGWVLTPHIGVEYTDSTQGAFTESGEMARRFDRGHYRNLSLPTGITVQKTVTLGGKPWSNAATVEYLPDVYRHQAGNAVRLLANGYAWRGEGSKPAREGVRVTISSKLQLNNAWSAYCSYRVEARDSYVGQTVVAGVGYSF